MHGITFDHLTRAEALSKDLLRSMNKHARKQGFKIDVAMTDSVYVACEDFVADIVNMAIVAMYKTEGVDLRFFWKDVRYRVIMTCEYEGSPPALTIMFPDEHY
jgi:hypothetical protein